MRPGFLRRMAVHRKLMTILMISSGAALLLAASMSILYAYFQVRADVAVNLSTSATLALANSRAAVSFEDDIDARDTLATLRSNPSVRLACLYKPSGVLFAEFRPDGSGPVCPASPPPEGRRFLSGRLELVERDRIDGDAGAWLLVRSDLRPLMSRLRTQAAITVMVFLVALGLAFVLSSSLQRIVSRPVIELANLAQAVSATGDYSLRAVKRTEDEFGVLADSMNDMLERVTRAGAEREGALRRERDANRTKDEFLATLSHELRTPLSSILGWTQLLRRKLVPQEEIDRTLERIERNAHAQNRLISDLLDMSRILSGKLSLQRHVVDLVPIARTAVESMLPLAQARGLALETVVDDEKLLAFIDNDRISQVLSNLLSNALKFTPAGGTVTVAARAAGLMQELSVTDTGAGISEDFLPRVFEPFRQADLSHTRAHGGLGLGLAIVKRITEMHGGDVSIKSRGIGFGTRVEVCLPAATEASLSSARMGDPMETRPVPNLAAYGILAVDDDADTRELVTATLAATGARIMTAGSVEEGLVAAVSAPPDVLITDIAMPDHDGYELVRRLREVLGARMPRVVLALSAFAADADTERSLALGFNAHLTKPFEPDLLVATIEQHLYSVADTGSADPSGPPDAAAVMRS